MVLLELKVAWALPTTLVVVHWQGRLTWVMVVMSLYMAEAELLAELELAVWLVVVQVQLQGQWGWMRKIGVDHNT